MIGLPFVYLLTGLLLAHTAVRTLLCPGQPRRWTSALFWGLLAFAFLLGDRVPPWCIGLLALALALLAGLGGVKAAPAASRPADPVSPGGRLFLPALAIPLLTLGAVLGLKRATVAGRPLIDPANLTLVSLGLACLAALALALWVTRQRPAAALAEGSNILVSIGWAAILPLYLAALGAVFAQAGVGDSVATLLRRALPLDVRAVAGAAYVLGMALFTAIMGNAFAAFPVMTAAIGLPILVHVHGANPAAMAAIGMLSGYCGTLLTPMAANFNLVPVALLELDDPHAVIRAQAPTALVLLAVNLLLMNVLPYL